MSTAPSVSRSVQIHDQLSHPVIDTDGHILEVTPVLLDYIREAGGPGLVERFLAEPSVQNFHGNNGMSVGSANFVTAPVSTRRRAWQERSLFWTLPQANTLDRATGMLPALMYERLGEIGIDLTILYPTLGLLCLGIRDDELRPVACRAFNTYYSELLAPYGDRMLPVALIPMGTPEEAVDELNHSVSVLGYRAVVLSSWATRPIELQGPGHSNPPLERPDLFALDSDYDYDPVWRTCLELQVAPTFHGIGIGRGVGRRGSVSNHMFNTTVVGGFTTWAQDICGALLFGGVAHRFSDAEFRFYGRRRRVGLRSVFQRD